MSHRLLVQPDDRSCGAAVAVACRMIADPAWASTLLDDPNRFTLEVLAAHRRLTGSRALGGSLQLPWPRALGTPPWALVNELRAGTGVPHQVRMVLPHRRASTLERVRRHLTGGAPVPLFLGNRHLPRHVVLLTGAPGAEQFEAYDPAVGGPVRFDAADFVAGQLRVAGWSTPWFTIEPTTRRTRA